MLAGARGFTALALLILALGIGANTAVFSILHGTLLRPPPYREPQRLVDVLDESGRETGLTQRYASYPDFEEYHRHARQLESVGAVTWAVPQPILAARGGSRPVLTVPATDNFFQVLGVQPALGRTFTPADSAGGCTVVLANALWQAVFGADPGLVGQAIQLDGRDCTVVGIMPAGFSFYPAATAMWRALTPEQLAGPRPLPVVIVGRLRVGATRQQAQDELRSLHAALHTEAGIEREMRPFVTDLQEQFTWVAGRNLRTTIWVLVGAVSVVLLIACLNVANLLLGRSLARQRELAVRAALGAGRGRLVRQLLTEGMLLAGTGGALGVGVAYAAVRYFRAVNPVELPVGSEVRLSLPALLFTGLVSLTTALVFGLAPAWKTARLSLAAVLRSGGRGVATGGRRTAQVLVAAQMALSVALLAAAGLLIESVNRMGSEPLGFRTQRLYSARIVLLQQRYHEEAARGQFYERLERALCSQPGLQGVALGNQAPPFHGGISPIAVEGRPYREDTAVHDVGHEAVSTGFFRTLGITVLRGRGFDDRDRADTEPVTVVNTALAHEYFPDTDPIGQRIRVMGQTEPFPWVRIVGVVAAVKRSTMYREMGWVEPPVMYRPMAQHVPDSASLVVAAAGSAPVAECVRRAAAQIDPEAGIGDIQPVERAMLKTMAYPRFRAVVFGAFAGFALLLAAAGLYGLLSQMVAQRRQEIGVRMAMGALPRDVVGLVLRQTLTPLGIGLAAGLAASLATTQWSAGLLYGVSAHDPAILGAVAAVLVLTGAVASVLPARRAARTNPTDTLRAE